LWVLSLAVHLRWRHNVLTLADVLLSPKVCLARRLHQGRTPLDDCWLHRKAGLRGDFAGRLLGSFVVKFLLDEVVNIRLFLRKTPEHLQK